MNNLEIYDKYRKVPKDALKDFNNGTFKGTDINTMWRIKMLTEEFGVCGIGWYAELIRQWSEPGANDEQMCFVEIKMYIKGDGEWSKGFSAVGGSKIVKYFKSKDYCTSNDEGYKMAYTDALGVACKYLGFGADIYWANDKTKYTTVPEAEGPTNEQLRRMVDLDIKAEALATYYKCAADQLSKNQVGQAIKLKEDALEKQAAKMEKVSGNV